MNITEYNIFMDELYKTAKNDIKNCRTKEELQLVKNYYFGRKDGVIPQMLKTIFSENKTNKNC